MPIGLDTPAISVQFLGAGSQSQDLSGRLESVQFGNSVPGGFGYFRAQLRSLDRIPDAIDYGTSIIVSDEAARTLFEGRIEDITTMAGGSPGFSFEAAGHQRLLDEPYRNIVVWRDLSNMIQRPLVENTNTRTDLFTWTVGPIDATGLPGLTFIGPAQAYLINQENSVLWKPPSGYDGQVQIGSVSFELTTTGFGTGTGTYSISLFGAAAAPATYASLGTNTTVVSALNRFYALTAPNNYGVLLQIACTASGTPASQLRGTLSRPRLMGISNATGAAFPAASSDGGMTGPQIIADILAANGFVSQDQSNIEADSFQLSHFGHFDSVTCRSALDEVTSYFNRYWAVWEGKKVYWTSRGTGNPTWLLTKADCLNLSLTGSIADAAQTMRVRYQNLKGQTREVDVADARSDNAYTAAGLPRTAIVDLGVVTAGATMPQAFGQIAFPSRSYEVVRGSVVLSAKRLVTSQAWGLRPAYTIRAGEVIHITDVLSSRDLLGSSFDRKSQFLVSAVDVDFDAQTVTLQIDNTSDHLAQLMARVSLGNKALFGV